LNKDEKILNQLLIGYPENHNYQIYKKLFSNFNLYKRLKAVSSFYPEKLNSFLDIGCCRGFYVLHELNSPAVKFQ